MKLQIRINGNWEYVFCYNGAKIITTKDSNKAIVGSGNSLEVFEKKFSNEVFRVR